MSLVRKINVSLDWCISKGKTGVNSLKRCFIYILTNQGKKQYVLLKLVSKVKRR